MSQPVRCRNCDEVILEGDPRGRGICVACLGLEPEDIEESRCRVCSHRVRLGPDGRCDRCARSGLED